MRPSERPGAGAPPVPPAPPPPVQKGRKTRKPWWAVVGVVGTLAVAGGLVVAYRVTTDATVPDRGVPPVDIPAAQVAASTPPAAPSGTAHTAVATPSASAATSSATPSASIPVPSSSPTVKTTATAPRVVARGNPSGANLALTATVTASSAEDALWVARYAADGDGVSRWASGFSDPQWLKVDLGENRRLTTVTLAWERAYAVAYRVEVSTDGAKWTTIWSTKAGQGGTVRVDADGAIGRYVRMYGTKRSNQYGFSLYEFEVR
ncbi:discoidin domain-containing protein [Actinoplanes solisilvae]|uniref:discoidin domain-containing protein n=1 Tax=Actinoplanes solisilvae TaxID=2486853 RepID=UPI000FD6DB87|nr:discoidin domain-containing protein [Actinoplanes solisilvae]